MPDEPLGETDRSAIYSKYIYIYIIAECLTHFEGNCGLIVQIFGTYKFLRQVQHRERETETETETERVYYAGRNHQIEIHKCENMTQNNKDGNNKLIKRSQSTQSCFCNESIPEAEGAPVNRWQYDRKRWVL